MKRNYYGSDHWKRLRRRALRRAEGKCERCGATSPKMTVHHRKRRNEGGADSLLNLEVLCYACHQKEHAGERTEKIRKAKTNYASKLLELQDAPAAERAMLQWRLRAQMLAAETHIES